MKIAIIGSGIAAATLVHRLSVHRLNISEPAAGTAPLDISVFEKSRGVGGRLATRRAGDWQFDHGAPFFVARSKSFQQLLHSFQSAGVVADWQAKATTLSAGKNPYARDWFEPHYVATPNMNGLCKALLGDQPIAFQTTIARLETNRDGHYLVTDQEERHGPFDRVISTAPAEQSQIILNRGDALSKVSFDPCFALMVSCQPQTKPAFDLARVNDSIIRWLIWSDRKPGRSHHPSLVALATANYSKERFEQNRAQVRDELLDEVQARLGLSLNIEATDLHRWKYAQTDQPLGEPFWLDATGTLAACGDWCLGNSVEDAFLSASALADWILQTAQR